VLAFMQSLSKVGSLFLVALLAWSCGDSETASTDIIVNPGESIQAAVDAAPDGGTVRVMPGDYVESHNDLAAIRITRSLTLVADSNSDNPVRILPGPGQRHGIVVEPENEGDPWVDGVQISGFTIEGFSNHGIWTRYLTNFVIENNVTANNLENGIFPTLSANGEVRKNVSYGSLDSSLWVEAAENIRVIDNELYNSPTGLEVTVSNDVYMEGNDIHDNTVGVGFYHPSGAGLPPSTWPSEIFRNWQLVGNRIYDNNFPNPVSGGLVGELPTGSGVLLLGVDYVEVRDNDIRDNDFFGVAIVDYCLAVDGSAFSCDRRPPFFSDVAPQYDSVTGNVILGNGSNPPPGPFAPLASDILVLGGSDNCASDNDFDTIVGSLPPC
jgi:hypothetical protein